MANWFAVIRDSDSAVVSFVSDDSSGFGPAKAGHHYSAAFPTQDAARAAIQPVPVDQNSVTRANLRSKASATWTLSDVADFLKTIG